jgi:glycosyltransferase involved in cell wall biosynthesis
MIQISVIIPTYNYAHYIVEAIDKTLEQANGKYGLDIVVIDDGSTDNTQFALKNHIETGKIRYFYQPNQGKAAATRKAIDLAKGKYIFNLDADDYFLPQKIEAFVAVFERYPSVVHVGSAAKEIDGEGVHLSTEKIEKAWADKPVDGVDLATYFLKNNTLWAGGSTYAARAEVLKKLVIPDNVDMYLDEYLILGILSKGKSYCFTDPLSIWRVHGNNYSNSTTQQAIDKAARLLKSSEGTRDALIKYSGLPPHLFKIYAFKHETRLISNLENTNKKSLSVIGHYTKSMWAMKEEGLGFFKRYTAFNRLLPTQILGGMKLLLGKKQVTRP